MKSRFGTMLFFLILIATFGLAVFLLITANETPAPGLILIGICGVALIIYVRHDRTTPSETPTQGNAFDVLERNRESYEQELERRRQEERDQW